MTKQDDLIAYIFNGQPQAAGLSAELLRWMDGSTRFTAFVDTYRDKIRKKVRVSRDPETLLDLRGELATACCLTGDRRMAVAYEPYASAKRRGPDFSVTYRANLVFNIEVARLRTEEGEENVLARKEQRLVRILLSKLGQMQPGMANLLLVSAAAELARQIDLARLMQEMKIKVEGRDPAFYAAKRYESPADFYKDFLRLSGMMLWGPGVVQVWPNKQARPGLAENVLRQVAAALQAGLPG